MFEFNVTNDMKEKGFNKLGSSREDINTFMSNTNSQRFGN
jgi:hypothetical protein